MSRKDEIGKHATTVVTRDGITTVAYHNTPVVAWVQAEDMVILDTGGYRTYTTKARMNQTAAMFGLPYHVRQRDGEWFVTVTYADGSTEVLLFEGEQITVEW